MPKKQYKLDTSIRKEYLYFIHPRAYEKDNTPIYKIGRTNDLSNRLKVYPKNSIIYKVIRVKNCYYSESRLINTFHMNFKHRGDIGREYFEGDRVDMMECMQVLIDTLNQEIKDDGIRDRLEKFYCDRHRMFFDGKISDLKPKQKQIARVVKNKVGEGKFSCDKCNKTFKRKGNLDYHVSKKVCKNKEHSCKYCGKSLTQTLKEEQLTDENDKPFHM